VTVPAFTHAVVVKLMAKPEAADEVAAAFLTDAIALANDEAGTLVWFSVRSDQTTFWVFDAFSSEADLQIHAAAPFADALRKNTDRWFVSRPEVSVSTVLGAKIPGQS
jgi:quinol monooxygenase YgiN